MSDWLDLVLEEVERKRREREEAVEEAKRRDEAKAEDSQGEDQSR